MAEVRKRKGGVEFDLRTYPPLKEFQFRMDRFATAISDWSGYFSALSQWFQAAMVKQFETEGEYTGSRWQPLTEPYRRWKQDHYPNQPIGVRTGNLRSAMVGGGGYSEEIAPTQASFGMSASSPAVPYGEHFSALRQVVRLTQAQGRETQKLAHQWLIEELRGAMGGSNLSERVRGGGFTGSALRQTGEAVQ